MGIVCGLDLIVEHTTIKPSVIKSIEITKGCGLTSEGYMILEKKDKTYTHAIEYIRKKPPGDLPFDCEEVPFYLYPRELELKNAPKIYKLVTCEDFNTILSSLTVASKTQPCTDTTTTNTTTTNSGTLNPLPIELSTLSLEEYVVVLFLEATEKDRNNCDMQDCDNGGEKMVFNLIPLLVPILELRDTCGENRKRGERWIRKAPEIKLTRYNVPPENISNAEETLMAFHRIFYPLGVTHPGLFNEIRDAYAFCNDEYRSVVSTTDSLVGIITTFKKLEDMIKAKPFMLGLEYIYDYLNDLILAYNEFMEQVWSIDIQCCANECCFPLHLVLGRANINTNEFGLNEFRQNFIYSPLFAGRENALEKLRFYFHRMYLMAHLFNFTVLETPDTGKSEEHKVIVTPSQYEAFPLSQRAIPFYYKVKDGPDPDNWLFLFWSFDKTLRGNETLNLSYHARAYSNSPLALAPLNHDIEKFNFFRIEGHLGMKYEAALIAIERWVYETNLPIDVVALSARFLGIYPTAIPPCLLEDIKTDLGLLIIQFLFDLIACLFDIFFLKPDETSKLFARVVPQGTVDYRENVHAYLKTFSSGQLKYSTGDFMKVVSPTEGTVGDTYFKNIKDGVFIPPISLKNITVDTLSVSKVSSSIFDVFGSVDALCSLLLNHDIKTLSPTAVRAAYEDFITKRDTLKETAKTESPQGEYPQNKELEWKEGYSIIAKLFEDCCCVNLIAIIFEILYLLEQAILRLENYEKQLVFSNYFRTHPGLEHKAGVPKGGTFVLVYSEPLKDSGETKYAETSFEAPLLGRGGEEISNGIVIADFYVPYLCCSGCSSGTSVLTNGGTVKRPPILSFGSSGSTVVSSNGIDLYSSSDKTEYAIDANPAGGILTGNGIQTDKMLFSPYQLSPGIHQVSYTVQGQTVNSLIQVSTPVNPNYNVIVQTESQVVFHDSAGNEVTVPSLGPNAVPSNASPYVNTGVLFINNSAYADSYSWSFGDNSPSTAADTVQPSPNHQYSLPVAFFGPENAQKIAVQLTGQNTLGAITSASNDITDTIRNKTIYVYLPFNEFLPDDTTKYPVTQSIPEGTVTGDGLSTTNNGCVFSPEGLSVGTHTITFSNMGMTSMFNVTIKALPQPSFTIAVTPTSIPEVGQLPDFSVQFTNTSQNADTYLWDFGDANSSSDVSQLHAYTSAFVKSVNGQIPVKLQVMNGVYPGVSSTNDIVVWVRVELSKTVYCQNDKTSLTPITNASGGAFSMDGTEVGEQANYKFSPLGMPLGNHRLVYSLNGLSGTFDFEILGQAVSSFVVEDIKLITNEEHKEGYSVAFKNTSSGAGNKYTFNFGDKETLEVNDTVIETHFYSKKNLKAMYTAQLKVNKKKAGKDNKILIIQASLTAINTCGESTVSNEFSLDISMFYLRIEK